MNIVDIRSKKSDAAASDILKMCAFAALLDITQEINTVMHFLAGCSPKGVAEFAGVIDKLPAEQVEVFMERLTLHADNLKKIADAIKVRTAKNLSRYANLNRETFLEFANECDGYVYRHTPIIVRYTEAALDLEKTK